MYDIKCLFAHLLDDEIDATFAPDEARVAHIHLRVDVQLFDLSLFLGFQMARLTLKPLRFYALVLTSVNQLVYNVVHFKADTVGLLAQYDALGAEKIAHETSLKHKLLVIQLKLGQKDGPMR